MIYTIGHQKSYTQYFREQAPELPIKLGKTADYVGGSVWKTQDDALKNCPEGYTVFGVIADWDKDTATSKDGNWNDLLIDAKLVKIYDRES